MFLHILWKLLVLNILSNSFKCAAYIKEETSNYYVFSRQRYRLLGTMLLFQCWENYWQLYFAALKIIARYVQNYAKIKQSKNYKYTVVDINIIIVIVKWLTYRKKGRFLCFGQLLSRFLFMFLQVVCR